MLRLMLGTICNMLYINLVGARPCPKVLRISSTCRKGKENIIIPMLLMGS